jgi:high-affinity iron transporter
MRRASFFCLILICWLAAIATVLQQFSSASVISSGPTARASSDDSENGQRWVFMLQYIASDYARAVQNGQIADSLEYGEMQRFASALATAYQSTSGAKAQISNKLRQLERLIADKAALQQIRLACQELIAAFVQEIHIVVFPSAAPKLANGEKLFQENCVACHGGRGKGDGPSADTLNPKPRNFTDPERMLSYAPYQFFQAISFGVEGTAMPAFAEAFTNEERWDLAFYLTTLRRDFHPLAAEVNPPLTLQQLATKSNQELVDILARQSHVARQGRWFELNSIIDYCRQTPPQPTANEYLDLAERLLKQSLAAYARRDSARANMLAIDAYLQGFEPIERELQYETRHKFERTHMAYQYCMERSGQLAQAKTLLEIMLDILRQIRKGKGWDS